MEGLGGVDAVMGYVYEVRVVEWELERGGEVGVVMMGRNAE